MSYFVDIFLNFYTAYLLPYFPINSYTLHEISSFATLTQNFCTLTLKESTIKLSAAGTSAVLTRSTTPLKESTNN